MLLLENLKPAPKIDVNPKWQPAIEFDGTQGEATTQGTEQQPDFSEFLRERGYNPEEYEIIDNSVRTSQWQVASPWPAEPRWLTSYRFRFRKIGATFLEPQPHDESLIVDVFGDGYHRLGLVHGHQANRPEGVVTWWQKQSFGQQPVAAATILASGHFHHLRVQEVASNERGASRYWIQASTLDNGSDWYRLNSGEDSQPGVVCFTLNKQQEYTGTVIKL